MRELNHIKKDRITKCNSALSVKKIESVAYLYFNLNCKSPCEIVAFSWLSPL